MDLATAIQLQAATKKQDPFVPVHQGAHARFTGRGYQHTGNKNRGGIATSEYFKAAKGNSRTVTVQADGSFFKTARTAKGIRKSRGKMDAHNMSPDMMRHPRPHAMKMEGDDKPDHMAEYKSLMKKSAAHQRAADALAQSHQEEDRDLYEQHAGKAWRLGNQAMKHFARLTKEQRAMLRDQHWQTTQPQPKSFGGKKVAAAKGCTCDHENWQHSTDGSCNVIGCDCTGKKVDAGGPGSGRHPGGGSLGELSYGKNLGSGWHRGSIGDHKWEAKVYGQPSHYGINDGRVSKLQVKDSGGKEVYNYDRGMDHSELPSGHVTDLVNQIESHPKMMTDREGD